jgi:translation initiation factor 2A
MPSERAHESSIAPSGSREFLLNGPTSFQAILPDGSAAFVHRPEKGIFKLDLTPGGISDYKNSDSPFFPETSRVQIVDVSPRGTFLLTWERAQEGETPNLKLWKTATGEYVAGFRQKSLTRDSWPYVQWTNDEKFAFLLATNEIRVYPGVFPQGSETRFVERIRIPGIASMSFPSQSKGSATGKVLFTSFIPKDKNKPSRAALYEYPSSKQVATSDSYPALVSKSLFQAEEMKVYWSPKGDAALIALQSTVDTSGQSYYGSTSLYLMSPQQDDTVAVPLPQEGPVLDVGWMPNPDKPPCFAVVAGRMPSMASLHNGSDGKATFLFGNRHQNTVTWAPHGRFVTLAGFGNLVSSIQCLRRNSACLFGLRVFTAISNITATTRYSIRPQKNANQGRRNDILGQKQTKTDPSSKSCHCSLYSWIWMVTGFEADLRFHYLPTYECRQWCPYLSLQWRQGQKSALGQQELLA